MKKLSKPWKYDKKMTLGLQKWPKTKKQHKMTEKMHYKITIFGAFHIED